MSSSPREVTGVYLHLFDIEQIESTTCPFSKQLIGDVSGLYSLYEGSQSSVSVYVVLTYIIVIFP